VKTRLPLSIREIHGHSMLPVLPPGTLVFGWCWFRSLKPGDIVIFIHEGKEKIKRIGELDDGRIFLLGDHAEASTDSRHFGWLDADAVVAKLIWPRAPKHRAEGVES
jgi:signal peptidase S26 family